MKKSLFLCIALCASLLLAAAPNGRPGRTLPDWHKGWLDIHFINSESGECLFCIFPDGTTMLIDAGETVIKAGCNPRGDKSASRIYADYIRHFLPATGSGIIDYALLTHFHIDHFGDARCSRSDEGGYAHMGMTALYDEIKYGKTVDRGYPTYGEDSTIFFNTRARKGSTSGCVGEWIKFVKHAASEGCTAERFALGSSAQFPLAHGGGYDFRVLNVVCNGESICRREDGSIGTKKARVESENSASCGVLISYGKFDFLTCGDITGAAQNVFAKYFLGSFKPSVELFKANHHLHHNAWGSGMTEVGFKPSATVSFSWCGTDPKHFPVALIEKVSAITDLYATSPKSEKEYPEAYSKMKDWGGHFVARVSRDGSFRIYKLACNETDFTVKAVYGPYRSR